MKGILRTEERIVYLCDSCGETFDVGTDAADPSCAACGSDEVRVINRG